MTEEADSRPRQLHRAALLDAAATAFARYGYERATVHEIASTAGCAEGLVHRYFGGKHGLLEAVLEDRNSTATATIQDLPEAPTAEKEIEQFLFWYIDSIRADKSSVVLFYSIGSFEEELWSRFDRYFDRHMDIIAARLEPFQARGEICPAVDLKVLAGILHSLSFDLGFHRQITTRSSRESLRALASNYTTLLLAGVACHHPDGHAGLSTDGALPAQTGQLPA